MGAKLWEDSMKTNRGVVYRKPGVVEVAEIPYPSLQGCEHGVILKVILAGICGSDQHMVRGRTAAPSGLILGHEITGEVIEIGSDVCFVRIGDIVSVPFNVACGRCRNCKEQKTNLCLSVNASRPGGAYGYVDMGGWSGGQAAYVLVPYADFNALVLPSCYSADDHRMKDFALLADIFPTAYHAAAAAQVTAGSTVYIAGAGPIGITCAVSCFIRGAAAVIMADVKKNRLERAAKLGCYTIDLMEHTDLRGAVRDRIGTDTVDTAIDCVGFEAVAKSDSGAVVDQPAAVLNALIDLVRAGGTIGIPGLYVTADPRAADSQAQRGIVGIDFGTCWSKAITLTMGQTPVMRYNYALMQMIIEKRTHLAEAVGVAVVPLDAAPEAYAQFDTGESHKYLIDPHGLFRHEYS